VYVEPLALAPLALGAAYIGMRLANTYRSFTPANIQIMMRTLILGIIPLDAIMLFAAGHPVGATLLLGLMVPGRILAKRMYVT
jgi:4-hydroxybenzoate polyprenyltransferase